MIPEEEFYKQMAAKKAIRVSVRAIVFYHDNLLVQQAINEAKSTSNYYIFPGGGLKLFETMVERLKQEFQEEFKVTIASTEYLFVVENFFTFANQPLHSLEHYFLVNIDELDLNALQTHEPYITHTWLPINELQNFDLRPLVVRDAILDGSWNNTKHLIDHD